MSDAVIAVVAAAALALAHLLPPHLRWLDHEPRSRALSFAGGTSVAYVLVHLLPEIAEAQEALGEAATGGWLASVERHAYVATLVGLVAFYGLDRAALLSRSRTSESETAPGVFWVSVGVFALYYAMVGYTLVERAERAGLTELALFTLAIGLHFVVNDVGLRDHHRWRYDRWGRWLLVPAPLVGVTVGLAFDATPAELGVVLAFLGGAVILNVLKEEVPEERNSRFTAFVVGAVLYTTLLLLL